YSLTSGRPIAGRRAASCPRPSGRIAVRPPRVEDHPLTDPGGREIRMSQVAAPPAAEQAQIEKLCTSIRGKLQFMDYLVRAAVADVDRFQGEGDAGTRIFLRQLIEMHASNLA